VKDQDDELLMSLLKEALGQEADVPAHRRTAARGAFAWRTIDSELLSLAHDSLVGADAGVRAAPAQAEARIVSFEGSDVSLELELVGDLVTGQVLPPQSCTITTQTRQGDGPALDVDDSGFFETEAPTDRPVRWRIELADRTLTSPWLT
jgi:hypothetical protein